MKFLYEWVARVQHWWTNVTVAELKKQNWS